MIKWIGSITLAVVLITIPTLTTLAFVYNWHDFFKALLVLSSLGEVLSLACIIWELED